jgi:hypothetical protein
VLRRYNYQYDSYVTKPVLFLAQMLLFGIYMSATGTIYGLSTQVEDARSMTHDADLIAQATEYPASHSFAMSQFVASCAGR